MIVLLLIGIVLGICEVARFASSASQQKQIDKLRADSAARAAESARYREEWRQQKAEALEMQRRQRQMEREQEKLAKEQQKQADQIAKHEKRIADLEFKAAQASADIEHLNIILDDLRESFELACRMADKAHHAGDEKREEQAKNKIITLRNKIHTAESRLAKAQHTHDMAERELSA